MVDQPDQRPNEQPAGLPAEQPVEQPTKKQIATWRRYLADERAEGAVYRELARKKTGEDREILLGLAEAEARHEAYWRARLGEYVGLPQKASFSTRMHAFLAERFGSVFVLALLQSAEERRSGVADIDAADSILADEAIHAEVVRGLAARGRARMSGDFRAAIFGANDGLVSNLALVLGMVGTGAPSNVVLVTGIAGLLAGALSMAAGEYVSVSSQQELLAANAPAEDTAGAVPKLDVRENELELVYRARGMAPEEARAKAQRVFEEILSSPAVDVGLNHEDPAHESPRHGDSAEADKGDEESTGSPVSAAVSSFLLFSLGAIVPVLPYLFGAEGLSAAVIACVLVGLALLLTGGIVGLLSGASPAKRAFRQLAIGAGAAAVTYGLGSLFDVSV
ncbi:VIT1/CCC1 transporter family protein [Corynebacterium sp. HMSC27B11]|uniref:VIT1/CCC1 transporter family protein n=1 Tax=Corynebacterium sp. HMSC27B11 TaxID=1581065 RepID=UPI0008A13D41|nr:VIT1/CCC1 transporter family protein [Corynebacterium sp. HMSC27B11]OFS17113.1 rubrerythrin family protein [Corynebacterium sp. HMSC27B11]